MLGREHTDAVFRPAYRWLPGILSFVAVPLLFILVLWPTNIHLNTQSVLFGWLVVILVAISILAAFIVKSRNRITAEDCLVFFFSVWLSVNYFLISTVNTPEAYWGNMLIAVVYCTLRVTMPEYRYLKQFVFVVLMFLLFYEASLGIRQALGLAHGEHGIYPVTGTFFNPGPFGGYLASLMAVAVASILFGYDRIKDVFGKIKNRKYTPSLIVEAVVYGICVLALVAGSIIFLSVFSRSAMVGLFASILVALCMHKPFMDYMRDAVRGKKRSALIVASVLVVAVIGSAGLYYAKKDSADGRVLMWKVGAETISQHPIAGGGLGTFKARYAESQANYFREHPESAYKSVAGVSEYAFNEYLLVASELGIVGIALLLSLFVVAFVNLIRRNDPYAYGLLALAIFAFFSYPFSILPLKILLVLFVASSANLRLREAKKRKTPSLALIGLLLCVFIVLLFLMPIYQEKADKIKQWQQAAIISTYDSEYSSKDYASLAQWHMDNPAFLFEYGRLHHLSGNYELSNRILKEGTALSADPMFYNVIGNNYKALGEIKSAEQSYIKAFDILPNRIYPKFLMMNLYEDSGDIERAVAMAKDIQTFNVKIESSATKEIREKARVLIGNTEQH